MTEEEEGQSILRDMMIETKRREELRDEPAANLHYAVHVVLRLPDDDSGAIPVREDVLAVVARDAGEAESLALSTVREQIGEPSGCGPDERRVLGVRKVACCPKPGPGRVLTSLEFEVGSEEELEAYLDGDEVTVNLR
jgi:hypothetical protein